MTDDTQAAAAIPDAEPTATATPTGSAGASAEAPEPQPKKVGRRGARPTKVAQPTKARRARKGVTAEEIATPVVEKVVAPPVAKVAKQRSPARAVKVVKTAKASAPIEPGKVVKSAKVGKRAKAAKTTVAEPATPATPAKAASRAAKAARPAAAKKPASTAARVRGDNSRYTTNELSSAVRKAGLSIEFTPTVTKPANIGRGPAKDFKVDVIVANLRGGNGDLIRDRGPGTPLYNDAESLAAVEIFEKFRGRTFHNKLKVEIL